MRSVGNGNLICPAHRREEPQQISSLGSLARGQSPSDRETERNDDRMLFTARSTFTASYFRPRSVLPSSSSAEMSSLVPRPSGGGGCCAVGRERQGREGATAFWPRFTRLSISERGRVRERGRRSPAANDLSQRRTSFASVHSLSLSLSSVLLFPEGSVPIPALISRGGEEGKQHTRLPSIAYMHALSPYRLFLHPQCSTYAHKYSSKNCSLLHPCRCCG